jgi:hypothetical protein
VSEGAVLKDCKRKVRLDKLWLPLPKTVLKCPESNFKNTTGNNGQIPNLQTQKYEKDNKSR